VLAVILKAFSRRGKPNLVHETSYKHYATEGHPSVMFSNFLEKVITTHEKCDLAR
jgi:hypothetical protein